MQTDFTSNILFIIMVALGLFALLLTFAYSVYGEEEEG